jgi:hypothetical protein
MPQRKRQKLESPALITRHSAFTDDGGDGGDGSGKTTRTSETTLRQSIARWCVLISVGVFFFYLLPREAKELKIFGTNFKNVSGLPDILNILMCYAIFRIMTLISTGIVEKDGIERLPNIGFKMLDREMVNFTTTNNNKSGFHGKPELFRNFWRVMNLFAEWVNIIVLTLILVAGFVSSLRIILITLYKPILPLTIHWFSVVICALFLIGSLLRFIQVTTIPLVLKIAAMLNDQAQKRIDEALRIENREKYVKPIKEYLEEMEKWVGNYKKVKKLKFSVKKFYEDKPEFPLGVIHNKRKYNSEIIGPYDKLQELSFGVGYEEREKLKDAGDYDSLIRREIEHFNSSKRFKESLKESPYDKFFKMEP